METVVKSIVEKIDREIENARNALAQDTMRLIRIKSVKGNPAPGALFGEGPKAVLDEVVRMARFEGFYTTDYGVGVVSAALKNKQPDLGIWLHGDVVPEGEGWLMPPYEPIEYKGCIIGRGATDNKGQLAAIFNLLKIFKNLGVPLCYNPAMYVGSDEESGMHDLAGIPDFANAPGFLKSCTPPKLSLVPDAGFPVGYGGKGSVYITLRTKKPLEGYTLTAGQENSPGRACAYFENADALRDMPEAVHTDDGGAEISTYSPPRHASSPDPNGNMITRLMEILLDKELVPKADRAVLEFFKQLSLDIHGNSLQINAETHTMKPLTVFAQKIETVQQYAELTINIRYPIEIAAEEIDRRLSRAAAEKGAVISKTRHTAAPYLLNPEQPVVLRLNRIANEITGSDAKPYTLSGATYAHCLPNALVYGMDGCLPPEDFPGGHGGAHGTDESVSLNRLQRGMKIYARALPALNEMEWR